MKFNGTDLEAMFKSAAGAAEDTGEDMDNFVTEKADKTSPKKPKPEVKEIIKAEPEAKPEPVEEVIEPKQEQRRRMTPPTVEKPVIFEKKNDRLGPVAKSQQSAPVTRVDVNSIARILEMKAVLDDYNINEIDFVTRYFQNENQEPAELIHAALTTDRRDLQALDKIVEARSHTSANRAFYLMELSANAIEAIYEQVDLITGELEDIGKISEVNKIKVCRLLEGQISDMPEETFSFISKLQEFTNKVVN